mgnify:CR=1 FL=1
MQPATFTTNAFGNRYTGMTLDEAIEHNKIYFAEGGGKVEHFDKEIIKEGWLSMDREVKAMIAPLYGRYHDNLDVDKNTDIEEWAEKQLVASMCIWYYFGQSKFKYKG